MGAGKSLPGYETVAAIPAVEIDGTVSIVGPTVLEVSKDAFTANNAELIAIINKWANVVTPGQAGGNISKALRDDLSLKPSDSDTDDERDITQKGQAANLTTENFEAQANIFLDEDSTAAGIYNTARLLLAAPDLPYVLAHRIGPNWDVDAAAGDTWNFFYVWTDNSITAYPDSANMTLGQTFVAKNLLVLEHELA